MYQQAHAMRAARQDAGDLLAGQPGKVLEQLARAREMPDYETNPAFRRLRLGVGRIAKRTGLVHAWPVRRLEGHTESVGAVHIGPDGRHALSGSADRTVRLWDFTTGECLKTFDGHTDVVRSVSMSPDGRWAVSGGWDETLRLWDLAAGLCLRSLKSDIGWIYSVAITPDGRRLLSGSRDSTVRLWDLTAWQCLKTFEGHADRVMSVCVSPDGRYGVSGSWDETVRLWDLATGRCLRVLEAYGHGDHSDGEVNLVGIAPNGQTALSAGEDRTLRLWDLPSGRCLKSCQSPSGVVTSACFTPGGRWMISSSAAARCSLCLWELVTADMWEIAEDAGPMLSVSISSDGTWVLAGAADGTLHLWELDWEYVFPGWADWDEAARPYLEAFLASRCPKNANAMARGGRPRWSARDFKRLMEDLQYRGLGWLRAKGVRRKLEEMADTWDGPRPLPCA
jgi:hypothetical protein